MRFDAREPTHHMLLDRLSEVTRQIHEVLEVLESPEARVPALQSPHRLGQERSLLPIGLQAGDCEPAEAAAEILVVLDQAHSTIFDALQQKGFSKDSSVLSLAQKAIVEVQVLTERLETCRERTLNALALEERRKRGLFAYKRSVSNMK